MNDCECDLCCVLASVQKGTTRIQGEETIEHTCHKLFWRCKCPGGTLTMQWLQPNFLGAEWVDIENWIADGEGYYYPCPLQANGTFRMKCTIDDLVYYSNEVELTGTTSVAPGCHCVDGSFTYRYQIEVDFDFEPDNGNGQGVHSQPFSGTAIWTVPENTYLGDPFATPLGIDVVITGAGPDFPCGRTGKVSVTFISGVKPVSFGGDGEPTSSTYANDMNSQAPCVGLLTCNPGPMTLVETNSTGHHPIYHAGVNAGGIGGPSYLGYSQINAVRAIIIPC